jgi:hypothetical protein
MKRFNILSVASLFFTLTVMTGGVAGAVPVITNGLVAAYEFTGNANDVSGNGNNGVVNGATLTADRFGNAGSAYSFDGADDSIFVGTQLNNLSAYTQAAWIRVPAGPGADPPGFVVQMAAGFFHYDQPNELIRIVITEDRVGGVTGNPHGSYVYSVPVAIPEESWVHLAVTTASDNTSALYLNGSSVDVGVRLFDGGNVGDTPDTLIGSRFTPNKTPQYNQFFLGAIDDVFIYDRALSSAEVQTLYSVVPEPNTALLLGLGLSALAVRRENR